MKKKIVMALYLIVFLTISLFGQTPPPPIWTTVSGSNVRNIPLSAVKSEVLRLADQYRFFAIEDHSRSNYRTSFSSGGNGPLLRSWEANNQNYVFALQDRTNLFGITFDLAQVFFVKGDRVYTIHFHPNSSAIATNSVQNDRRYLEQLIDSHLNGMTNNSTQPNTTDNRPLITIINNTGYTVWYVYVTPSTADHWGDDLLRPDQVLRNGESVSIRLGQQLSVVNRYDIQLIDLDGDSYTKWDIIITPNARITFIFDDIDWD